MQTKTKPENPKEERSRGRPSDQEGGKLQSVLLDTAEELFAEYGYAATSVRALADAAGVNPALVHYYFGSKRELLMAVMDRALEPIALAIAAQQERSPAGIEEIATMMFTMISKHPGLPRLIAREVMLSGGEMQTHFAKNYAPRLGGAVPGLIDREKRAGRIRKDFEPGAATLMLLGLCMFPFIARSIAEPVLEVSFDKAGLQAYIAQVRQLLTGGMSA